jgi:hypothetical protein
VTAPTAGDNHHTEGRPLPCRRRRKTSSWSGGVRRQLIAAGGWGYAASPYAFGTKGQALVARGQSSASCTVDPSW